MTCDTRGIDDLQCEATGVKAESDALAAVAEALAKRRTDFETARSAYTQARDAATQAVKDLNRRVDDLLDDTRCLLNKDDVDCIDEAFGQVLDCLEDCDDEAGCCVDEGCGFEGETWTVGQIDDLRAQVVKVEKCFDEVLVKEPANLTDRVTKVTGLVDKLAEDLKADPREDANRLYARAKHARWVLDAIWGRFADVNEFQNCLCCGLTCSLRGRQWLALARRARRPTRSARRSPACGAAPGCARTSSTRRSRRRSSSARPAIRVLRSPLTRSRRANARINCRDTPKRLRDLAHRPPVRDHRHHGDVCPLLHPGSLKHERVSRVESDHG